MIVNLPVKGWWRAFCVLSTNGIYHLTTYPHVASKIERLECAVSTSPMGPFKHAGVILDESEAIAGRSTIPFWIGRGQSYLFYHDRDLSPSFGKNRSIRADKLFFNADGTIQKVDPDAARRGLSERQRARFKIDRQRPGVGSVAVTFLDDANPHAGWKTTFGNAKSWVRFNEVDFGQGAQSPFRCAPVGRWQRAGDRLGSAEGPLLGRVKVDKTADWKLSSAAAQHLPKGVHDIVVTQTGGKAVEVGLVSFQ